MWQLDSSTHCGVFIFYVSYFVVFYCFYCFYCCAKCLWSDIVWAVTFKPPLIRFYVVICGVILLFTNAKVLASISTFTVTKPL